MVGKLLILIFPVIFLVQSENLEKFEFPGQEFWDSETTQLCDDVTQDTTWQWSKAVCFEYFWNFQAIKMEVLAFRPALVIFRDLFSKNQVDQYLKLMETMSFEEQMVVDDDGKEFTSKVRRANGTTVIPEDHPAAQSIFNTVKNSIPVISWENAEEIIALTYNPGGHYATHLDYLVYPSENEWDSWMRDYGNRLATLIMVFKTAKRGGATVFPVIGATVRPNPGDAFMWFNAKGDLSQEDLTEHGGCPIYEGRKIISTIWVRMKNQKILESITNPDSIPAHLLIPDI